MRPTSSMQAPPPCLRFPATALFVRFDELASALVAAIRLPLPIESLLFMPAHAFGAPLVSLCVLPSSLAVLVVPHGSMPAWQCNAVAVIGVIACGLVPIGLVHSSRRPMIFFHKGRHIPAACACTLLGLYIVNRLLTRHSCSTPSFPMD